MTKYFKQEDGKEMREITYESVTESLLRKEVISIQPGDKIIITSPMVLSEKATSYIIHKVEGLFPGTKCLLLEDGMKMEVYREQKYGPLDVTGIDGIKAYVCGNCPDCSCGRDFEQCPKRDREQKSERLGKLHVGDRKQLKGDKCPCQCKTCDKSCVHYREQVKE